MRRMALVPVAGAVLLVLAGGACSNGSDPVEDAAPEVGHVHGLGVDPEDPNAIYLATHLGMFRLSDDGVERRGALFQDTMGFTVTADGRLLGSGHPDLRDDSIINGDMAPHLGLIESRDGAATWEPLSLQGEADLHVIQSTGDLVYGYDASNRRLLVSDDMITWTTRARLTLTSVAVDPTRPQNLLATSGRLTLIESSDGGRAWTAVEGAPPLTHLSWSEDGARGGLGPDGTFWRSAGRRFQRGGAVPGVPAALLLSDERWYAATDLAVYRSDDNGRSWDVVLDLG